MRYPSPVVSNVRTRTSLIRQLMAAIGILILLLFASSAMAQSGSDATETPPDTGNVQVSAEGRSFLNVRDMLAAGGTIGYIIVLLSFVMVALIIDQGMTVRRTSLMPPGLAEEVHRCLAERKFEEAKKLCEKYPGYLSRVLQSGLDEIGLGYSSIEKAMEDAAVEQSARLFRRAEFLSVISALAPMLGLMGTVWGMILAFMEFEQKANPQVSELAPGIYRALITTLQGLAVAIPSLAAFSFFRNRIDELSAETALLAEHVFADYRRASMIKRTSKSSANDSQANG
ncbi:MAG: MotA/TolQ/ExbB proton channel family protein [Planctomyces sp.]|nr:MotA/TolQ/ExbB proton channel family protein [Planctomyces sp.]